MGLKSRVTVAALAVAAAGIVAQRAQTQQPTAANAYVDPATCRTCHADIAAKYMKTGMGRSFYSLQPANVVEDLGKPYYHQPSDSYLVMFERGGKYYQRRWQKGFDGSEINVDEKRVDYVMGSGNHGRSYIHVTDRNTLQELPLGWYAEKGGYWAMSPGFDRPDYPGSTRVVTYECVFCHNGYPKIPAGHEETGARPEFVLPLPEGIDCQRCHGPGQRHVETASKAGATADQIRAAIVNPKRLSPERELEVCMQCHLETTPVSLPHDIRRWDRGPFSYVPGQPLGDFRITFDRAGGMGEIFEIAHAAYRMRESQCFLKSEGKLRCTTCHDPHDIPRGEAATAHYNTACRNCHAAAFQQTVASGTHTSGANCISCHMPKRRTDDAVRIVMTDHFIRSRQPAGDLLAAKPEPNETTTPLYRGEVVPYYPANLPASPENSLYVALAQITERNNLTAGLPLLKGLLEQYRPQQSEYYADLAEGLTAAGQRAQAIPYFEQAVEHAPNSEVMLRKLGSAQMEAGQLTKAEATLRRVVALMPDDAGAWGMLGQVLWQESRRDEAIAAFRKGIASDAELPELHSSLGVLLMGGADLAPAEKEFREALRIQPGNATVQANLGSLLASRGATFAPEARYYFDQSLRLKPNFAEARLNYARLLLSIGQTAEAEKQAQASVEEDARVSAAHEIWGTLLGMTGDLDGAVREFQSAVRLQPDLWSAQYELGVALGKNHDYTGAEEHLKIAAQGSDPEAKAASQELLQRLGH